MRILMFDYEYPPLGGGGGVVHEQIAEVLATRHRVCVITSAYRDLPRREIRGGVEILRVPVFGRTGTAVATMRSMVTYPPSAWVAAHRLLRSERFDVINGHFAVPTGPGSLPCAKLARIPHVLSIHGGDIYDPSKALSPHRFALTRIVVDGVLRHSDVVVAQSQNTRDNVYRYYRYRRPIRVIPLGIRIPSYPPATREDLGLPPRAFLAVTVGRLLRRKRLDHLLQALARPDNAEIYLAVVGTGPELGHLRAAASELGVAGRVLFRGEVSDQEKWQLLGVADTYVSSTMHEGFGLVYVEAMAAGLPVITYDEGGQVDFLEDRQTGFLVPEGDVDALATTLSSACRDPDGLAEMGNANRLKAEQFRVERCAEAYEALFEEVCAADTST